MGPSGRHGAYSAVVPFPSPPWSLRAEAWLSLFVLPSSAGPAHPAGVYGAAFADYREGGALTYHELLVGRLARPGLAPGVRITDIWVDSPESMAGGRALWALPKQLAELPLRRGGAGPLTRTSFEARAEGRRLASGTFTALPGAAVLRTPYRAVTCQERADGAGVVTPLRGSARVVPCHAAWAFDADGPLWFLNGRRPLATLLLRDVRLQFG